MEGLDDASTRHQSYSASVEKAFFDSLGSDPRTAAFCAPDSDYTRKFYKFVSGPKTDPKQNTINNCVYLFAMKGYYTKEGRPCQPNTVETRLKTLFACFCRHGVTYSMTRDFNFQGRFADKLKLAWGRENDRDPTFGRCPTKQALPEDYNKLIREAVLAGAMDITSMTNSFHLLALFAMSLGTLFGFHGVKVRTSGHRSASLDDTSSNSLFVLSGIFRLEVISPHYWYLSQDP